MGGLRGLAAPFVVPDPSGVAVRTRLKQLTTTDVEVLRQVGAHLGALASRDLTARCRDGLDHDAGAWAVRKRALTPLSSARWAGAITKASHDQWALARRSAHAYLQSLEAGTRLLHWATTSGVKASAVEDLDFTAEKTREKHGRKRRFRQLISGMPTSRLRARLTSMADATGITIIAVDPAYTSRWGAQHWQNPLTSTTRKTTRHDAASIAIGRRAQGYPIRRRTAPPRTHQSDGCRHRSAQTGPETPGREGTRPRLPGPRTRSVPPDAARTRVTRTSRTVRDVRSAQEWVQDSLLLTE
ncbi:IS200/IS605 family element transposase accessory protein TnpB [Streptomyces rubrogriseus]|uniref:IS200/IS605 family element transposase accessory protein TnpB n=1 Tax=Streptomyces rubrogriseus TaxID=194673 RepID=UPI000D5906DC|nr:IS200/IS605 family element transposase accessory protein TnpB [Streptomyces rubrogriseus]